MASVKLLLIKEPEKLILVSLRPIKHLLNPNDEQDTGFNYA